MNNIKTYPLFIRSKNILSIDYGTKFVGLASFFEGNAPFPMPYSRLKNVDEDCLIAEIKTIISLESFEIIVLGVPYYLDGNESEMTKKIKLFGKKLEKSIYPIKVFYQDESLSSFEAEDRMKNSPKYNFKINYKNIDALAASIILEDWLKSFLK